MFRKWLYCKFWFWFQFLIVCMFEDNFGIGIGTEKKNDKQHIYLGTKKIEHRIDDFIKYMPKHRWTFESIKQKWDDRIPKQQYEKLLLKLKKHRPDIFKE